MPYFAIYNESEICAELDKTNYLESMKELLLYLNYSLNRTLDTWKLIDIEHDNIIIELNYYEKDETVAYEEALKLFDFSVKFMPDKVNV